MSTEQASRIDVRNYRRPVFYVAVVGALGLFTVVLQDLLPKVVTAWYVDIGPHRFHDLNFLAMVWLALLGLALQLYRPTDRVTATVLPILVMAPLAAMAVAIGSPIAMLPILFTVVGVVVVALHPAGRSVLRFERADPVDRGLLALIVIAAVPLAVYAVSELGRQFALTDEHATLVHYGAMALTAALIVVLGLFAAIRRRDWRFASWGAGGLAVYLGAGSLAFPSYTSAADPFWGGLAVAWGVTFVAATEVTRRDAEPLEIERATELDAPRADVWDFVNDFDRMTEWVDFADELTYLSDGSIGEGTIYREIGGIGPMTGESEWEITVFDPPERQVHVGDLGVMRPVLTMTFDATESGGTRFRQHIELRAFPRVRPLGWLLERLIIGRAMGSGLADTQRDLKRLIEDTE